MQNPKQPIDLDGRTLEGGGQLLRNAVCLSALTGTPISIHHIRGSRSSGGGLKSQHLACVNWLAYACNARVEGAEKGSTTLVFEPGKKFLGEDPEAAPGGLSPAFRKVTKGVETLYECARLDIGTAGSTGLALQAILPFILFSDLPSEIPVRLTMTGGTNVSGSPSYEYIVEVLLPTLHAIGFPKIEPGLKKRGWSHGGSSIGEISFTIPPRAKVFLPAFRLQPTNNVTTKPSKPTHLKAIFIAPASCHEHFHKVLQPAILHHFGESFTEGCGTLEIKCEGSLHEKRMYLILVATLPSQLPDPREHSPKLGSDWLYDRKIRSHERAATEMAEAVTNALATEAESGAYVDDHMRDQLVIFQALTSGASQVYPGVDGDGELREPSLHLRTAEWVAKMLLEVKFDAQGVCDGVGFGVDVGDGLERSSLEDVET